jgi:hypothetical protein
MILCSSGPLGDSWRAGFLLTAGFVCLLGLAACSGNSPVAYPGTAKLAQALNAKGVSCTDLSPVPKGGPVGSSEGGLLQKRAKPLVKEAGTCRYGKSRLLLFIFRTEALRDRWMTLGKLYGSIVTGPNWSVSTHDDDTAGQIKDALGGELR